MGRGKNTIQALFTVLRAPGLTPGEKTLWGLYRSYDSGRGAWPSDETLAEHMGRSVSSVQKYRAGLLKHGYLRAVARGPFKTVYHAILPGEAENPEAPTEQTGSLEGRRPIEILNSQWPARVVQPQTSPDPHYRSDAQRIADKVIEVGLNGVRPSNYPKQVARAQKLLEEESVEYWLEAIDYMRDTFPYSKGEPFDVFTLGAKAHLGLAKASAPSDLRDLYPHEW